MPMIPTLHEAEIMVRTALKERAPDAYNVLESVGGLRIFSRQLGQAMQQMMDDLNDPGPVLRGREESPIVRMQQIREIRDHAVEHVLTEMLSTARLNAEVRNSAALQLNRDHPRSDAPPRTLEEVLRLDPDARIVGATLPSRTDNLGQK